MKHKLYPNKPALSKNKVRHLLPAGTRLPKVGITAVSVSLILNLVSPTGVIPDPTSHAGPS